jgi:hypothetical protein
MVSRHFGIVHQLGCACALPVGIKDDIARENLRLEKFTVAAQGYKLIIVNRGLVIGNNS